MKDKRMTLIDEKKLVAEWMGWEIKKHFTEGWLFRKKPDEMWHHLIAPKEAPAKYQWNPHRDRNCWPQIWEKMDYDTRFNYMNNLPYEERNYWSLHTGPPDICWKALVKTLGDR